MSDGGVIPKKRQKPPAHLVVPLRFSNGITLIQMYYLEQDSQDNYF